MTNIAKKASLSKVEIRRVSRKVAGSGALLQANKAQIAAVIFQVMFGYKLL